MRERGENDENAAFLFSPFEQRMTLALLFIKRIGDFFDRIKEEVSLSI